jgi:hypothetical protein
MKSDKMKREGLNTSAEAARELKETGLTVDDVAGQSAYEDDTSDVTHQVADSNRSKSARKR